MALNDIVATRQEDAGELRALVVGPSFHFASGISAYTHRLSHELEGDQTNVSVLLLRRLVPQILYPGRRRVGVDLGFPEYDRIAAYEGIDWFWGRSLLDGVKFLESSHPDVVILQWWTVSALHTYLLLSATCRRRRIPFVIEFHELQDPGEAANRWAARLNRHALPRLARDASGFIVHNEHDRRLIEEVAELDGRPVAEVPLGPFDHFARMAASSPKDPESDAQCVTNLLFLGLIRPYKGVEDLVEAFDGLPDEQAETFSLRIVGETWEGWTKPSEAIERSKHASRIEFVNRYVSDQEVADAFRRADAAVFPYRRASSSGPLNIAMAMGLPVIIYDIPALVDATRGYEGVLVVPSGDVVALSEALLTVRQMRGSRFTCPRSWAEVLEPYRRFLERIVQK